MTETEVYRSYQRYIVPSYQRTPLCLVSGRGCWVTDLNGRRYLDFFPGWAVSGLGHCHPRVVKAIREQAGRLLHVSNNYHHPLQAKLAAEIIKASFPGKCFFANSGAEANEGALKLARLHGRPEGRYQVISFRGSFHGRTLATLTLTGQAKVQKGFAPLPAGFRNKAVFNDLASVEKLVNQRTAAVILEPIQGEGGVKPARPEFLAGLRRLCDREKLLLIFDEVQSGLGRTGRLFAFQHYGIRPDAMTLAKTLGGGVPIGALVVAEKYADLLQPGTHASTF
ncbi:MAG TPA: aminotransferase class III-fold pyridoxal phosphate-dependent enzyme, partial [bacterium]|nr:aminotransferase class III-fold pyridoxal phosphate-dependent enzyme [bacterium]